MGAVRSSICLITIPGDDRKDKKETAPKPVIAETFQECFPNLPLSTHEASLLAI